MLAETAPVKAPLISGQTPCGEKKKEKMMQVRKAVHFSCVERINSAF
jgi:hypothetical protein